MEKVAELKNEVEEVIFKPSIKTMNKDLKHHLMRLYSNNYISIVAQHGTQESNNLQT